MKEILVADDGGHILNQLQNNFAAAFLPAVFGRNNVALGGVEASGSRSMERALPVPILPSAGTAGASGARATTKIQLLEHPIPPPAPLSEKVVAARTFHANKEPHFPNLDFQ